MASLVIFGILGAASTFVAFYSNRRLFGAGSVGPVSLLEGFYYVVGAISLVLGWYFNVRYVNLYGHRANYWNYITLLFTNWAADSAAQDYTIVNLVLMPFWTIVDGRRRGLRNPWIFFVMSFFTSLAFSIAMFLAFTERQLRYNNVEARASSASSTA